MKTTTKTHRNFIAISFGRNKPSETRLFEAIGISNIHPTIAQWAKLVSESMMNMLKVNIVGRAKKTRKLSWLVRNVMYLYKLTAIRKPVVGSKKKIWAEKELKI